ncbi:MAG: hypothetical protein M1371_06525 [Actinobacteria bacterium]|nr:hypothetical protein [Actinomycetota bacterium]
MLKPKVGVAVMAFPGFNLEEDDCPKYLSELSASLRGKGLDLVVYEEPVISISGAEKAADAFNSGKVDCYVLLIGTFVPDFMVMPIATGVAKPVIVWANDRNIYNVSITGSQNVTPTLWEAGIEFRFVYGELEDPILLDEVYRFTRACALKNKLKEIKVGYWGGHPNIMTVLNVDEVATRMILGPTLVNFGNEDIFLKRDQFSKDEVKREWGKIKDAAGNVKSTEENGLISAKTLLYILQKVKEYSLDAVSINCFPYLKGQVCIPVARLNDYGIPSACEGDLNSTILMYMLYQLSGKAVANSDQLKVLNKGTDENSMIFSHCGAGALSLATSKDKIVIHEDYETGKGIGVYFPETIPGEVTVCNLVGFGNTYRMFITKGKVIETDMIYEGNPMNVQFDFDIRDMLKKIAECGFGHHWNLAYGDFIVELREFCNLVGINYMVYP